MPIVSVVTFPPCALLEGPLAAAFDGVHVIPFYDLYDGTDAGLILGIMLRACGLQSLVRAPWVFREVTHGASLSRTSSIRNHLGQPVGGMAGRARWRMPSSLS